jgi:hypothetical protein
MLMSPSWKVVLALSLATAIAVSVFASAPRRTVPREDLRRLVFSALSLFVVGGLALLTHHSSLAGVLYAAGAATFALAAWLSRGTDSEDPPRGDEPVDEEPPPEPDGMPTLDWDRFEKAFREYSERTPSGVS